MSRPVRGLHHTQFSGDSRSGNLRTYSIDQTVDTVLESDLDDDPAQAPDAIGGSINYLDGVPPTRARNHTNERKRSLDGIHSTAAVTRQHRVQRRSRTGSADRSLQSFDNYGTRASGDSTQYIDNQPTTEHQTAPSTTHSTRHQPLPPATMTSQYNSNNNNVNPQSLNGHAAIASSGDEVAFAKHVPHHGSSNTITLPVRRWTVWPARNRFYCDGRVIMSMENKYFLVTVFLITSIQAMFWAFDCRLSLIKLGGGAGWAVVGVSIVLFLAVMTFLCITSFSDPGIIPKASEDERDQIEKLCTAEEARFGNYDFQPRLGHPPSPRLVIINGVEVKLKYCYTCKIFRPPRTSHCSICNNCVYRFDHHCPWVGNCVGYRNYRFFFFFLASLSTLTIYIFAFSIANLVLLSSEPDAGFLDAIKQSPTSIVVIIVCFVTIWSVVGLAMFHMMLACNELTTHEDLKGQFQTQTNISNEAGRGGNPYARGTWFENFKYVLFSRRLPSLIDARAYVDPKMPLENKPAYPDALQKFTSPHRVFKETTSIREYTQHRTNQYRHASGGGVDNPAFGNGERLLNTGQTAVASQPQPSQPTPNGISQSQTPQTPQSGTAASGYYPDKLITTKV